MARSGEGEGEGRGREAENREKSISKRKLNWRTDNKVFHRKLCAVGIVDPVFGVGKNTKQKSVLLSSVAQNFQNIVSMISNFGCVFHKPPRNTIKHAVLPRFLPRHIFIYDLNRVGACCRFVCRRNGKTKV